MPPTAPRVLLHIYRSDGDRSQWPRCIRPDAGAGSYNYYEEVDDTDPKAGLYLVNAGRAIVAAYNEHPERAANRPAMLIGKPFSSSLYFQTGIFFHHEVEPLLDWVILFSCQRRQN